MSPFVFLSPFPLVHLDFVWLLTCKTHEEVKKPLRPQQRVKKGRCEMNVNVDGRIRKLLLTFEPPSFVIAENHGTVTTRKDNHGDIRQKDCLRNMWLFREQKNCESSKGKENSFPGCAFCLVCIGFPNSGIPLLWYCSDRNKQLLVMFHYAELIWGFMVDLETLCCRKLVIHGILIRKIS